MTNYLRALNDACAQKPGAGTGRQVKLGFSLFPNGTSAAPSSALASPSGTATAIAGAALTPAASPGAITGSNGASATKVGLGVGLGLGLPRSCRPCWALPPSMEKPSSPPEGRERNREENCMGRRIQGTGHSGSSRAPRWHEDASRSDGHFSG